MARLPSIWEDPFKLTTRVGSLLDRLDEDFGFGLTMGYGRTDIYEKDGELHYEIELPGVKKEDVTARIEDNVLIVKGNIKRDETVEENNYLRMERRYGSFQKSFVLPEEAETTEGLKAKFQDGILKISIPLKESLRGEVIDINIE